MPADTCDNASHFRMVPGRNRFSVQMARRFLQPLNLICIYGKIRHRRMTKFIARSNDIMILMADMGKEEE